MINREKINIETNYTVLEGYESQDSENQGQFCEADQNIFRGE